MSLFYNILLFLFTLLAVYFAVSGIYLLVFSIFGHFYKKFNYPQNHDKIRKICILVPAYKEDKVILNVAKEALKQQYPSFDVVIIADSFMKSTLDELEKLPIILLEIENPKRTKANALNIALNKLQNYYDIALILDGDNIFQEKDFLSKINLAFTNGVKIVQGHRTAKNFNTNFALLDAISEEINNHIFRKGHRALGLSSALIGSAMAFDFDIFKEKISKIETSGEDKELEFMLLKEGFKFEYLDDAVVLDEKTQKSDVFVKQRSRWLANQFLQARLHFFSSFLALFKGKLDFFDKSLQHFLLPRILLLGTAFIFSILSGIFLKQFFTFWLIILFIILFSLVIAVPKRFYNYKTLLALLSIPKGYLSMILSLLNMKGASKKFVVTEKNYNNRKT